MNRPLAERIGVRGLCWLEALGKANAYLIWGVDDRIYEIVGTGFKSAATKVGNEELEKSFCSPCGSGSRDSSMPTPNKKQLEDDPEKERALAGI